MADTHAYDSGNTARNFKEFSKITLPDYVPELNTPDSNQFNPPCLYTSHNFFLLLCMLSIHSTTKYSKKSHKLKYARF
jgi:hypothetical protein